MTISHSMHRLFTRESRLELANRDAPYWSRFARGRSIGYRRGKETTSWFSRVRLKEGRNLQRKLGQADDDVPADGEHVLSFPQALAAAENWCNQYEGIAIDRVRSYEKEDALPKLPNPPPYTVAHAIIFYLEYLRDNKTIYDRAFYQVRAHILPDLGSRPVDELKAPELRKWLIELSERPPRVHSRRDQPQQFMLKVKDSEYIRKRKRTSNKVLATLKAALNRAFEHGLVDDDSAWAKVRGFRNVDRRKAIFLEAKDIHNLVKACPPDLKKLVAGALLTGCRVSELRGMLVRDFSRKDGRVKVTDAKSKERRAISLSNEGIQFFTKLVKRRSETAPMFLRANGTAWRRSGHWKKFQLACEGAGIRPPIRFYDLRHTYASQAIMAGVPMKVVSTQLGHTSTRMVDRFYGRVGSVYIDEVVQERMPYLLE